MSPRSTNIYPLERIRSLSVSRRAEHGADSSPALLRFAPAATCVGMPPGRPLAIFAARRGAGATPSPTPLAQWLGHAGGGFAAIGLGCESGKEPVALDDDLQGNLGAKDGGGGRAERRREARGDPALREGMDCADD